MRMSPYRAGVWQTHRPLLLLIGAMTVFYILQLIFGRDAYLPFMAVPTEIVESVQGVQEGDVTASSLWELVTLFTCTVLHGSPEHLLFNMIFFWMFAALALDLLGARWMFIIFFVTGVCGSICHVMLNSGDSIPMLGASGALMGFEGAYLAMAFRWRLPDPHVWPISRPVPPARLAIFALVSVAGDYLGISDQAGSNIAYGAHIGGFIAGVALAGFVAPRPKGAHPK